MREKKKNRSAKYEQNNELHQHHASTTKYQDQFANRPLTFSAFKYKCQHTFITLTTFAKEYWEKTKNSHNNSSDDDVDVWRYVWWRWTAMNHSSTVNTIQFT